jgi:hypothetical protein
MSDQFESKKNIRAFTYTGLVLGSLLLIFIFVRWTIPTVPEPLPQDGIEVNLGNSDQGLGDDQPEDPGKPAPSNQPKYTPPAAKAEPVENLKSVETDDRDEEAPTVKQPPVVKPEATKIPEKEPAKPKVVKITQPVPNPVPAPPRPKAVFKGVSGNGTGGNEADDYRKGGNQGIAGGSGDQGKPGGSPTATNYEGNGGHGTGGVSISRGLSDRRIARTPNFEDEFNENAKVAVDVRVSADGSVISATYQARGSTTSDGTMKSIALNKARQVKFTPGADESTGTIVFNFKLRN